MRSRRRALGEAASWGPMRRRRGKLAATALMSSLVLWGFPSLAGFRFHVVELAARPVGLIPGAFDG
ncbi:MAG TPA: hypothetical protein VGH69_00040 [Mycobacterium sp.]